ncbi:hypothetical protein M409DRAFT_26323 [Zasmidium cellare ATCC 36951]|uniref:FAD-binding domain-containing protein n=1 Tax=Zasmidium cellare ATCC 36951 TaxID=1080233 RepID=A0A6A6C8B7_ZASCE|nr:uncharacterized protein M409DRAFT_26323 [Zasmidium cellare ATCC 36951]KAF2163281.1 hypothetical protein M409DRAFT_26323 [Zasmidium cellare ATCC 36951]
MPPLKILISGGGVAGTALAFWLSKLGHSITVVEHYSSLRTTGLQIDLRSHGVEVLRRMGLEPGFRERKAPEEGMQFIDAQGRNRGYFGAATSGDGNQGITSEYEIMRGDLCRLIYDATHGKAKYVFGSSIQSYCEVEKGVEVEFKNGQKERYDLVVGADGVWSSLRRMMMGDEAGKKAFHFKNETNAYLTYKQPVEKGERYVGQMYIGTDKRSLLIRRHNPQELQLYLLLSRPDERIARVKRGDIEEEKKAFQEIYQGAGWRTNELLEKMMTSEDFYCERLGIVKMDSWWRGHVALVGDAAYGPGGSGMGTTTAMVGAYILAGEIGVHCKDGDVDGIQAALAAYDARFRPFMTKLHAGLESEGPGWLFPSSAWGIAVFHVIVQLFATLRLDMIAKYFMWETQYGWDLPKYEGLEEALEREKEKGN